MSTSQRAARGLGVAAGVLLLSAIGLEVILQIGSRFVADRGGEWRQGAHYRVLSVGDSHTYGAFVPRDQTYPAHLQQQLDRIEPDAYSVLNRGIPGMSTAQVRSRLPLLLARHQPDLVIVWAGVNNSWNTSDSDGESGMWSSQLAGLASRSRLYRLLRVGLHDLALERVAADAKRDWQVLQVSNAGGKVETWRVRHDGREETIVHTRDVVGEDLSAKLGAHAAEIEANAERDYAQMVEQTRMAGAEVVLITYPYNAEWFAVSNRAMGRVSERYELALVNSSVSVHRLPKEQQQLTWAAHPTEVMYREIARDLVPVVRDAAGRGGSAP